jgi:hypothetical protein
MSDFIILSLRARNNFYKMVENVWRGGESEPERNTHRLVENLIAAAIDVLRGGQEAPADTDVHYQ